MLYVCFGVLSDLNMMLMLRLCILQFLVLDEADRLVERGHFEGLEAIIQKIKRTRVDTDDATLSSKLRCACLDHTR